jgi:hypothetical protein
MSFEDLEIDPGQILFRHPVCRKELVIGSSFSSSKQQVSARSPQSIGSGHCGGKIQFARSVDWEHDELLKALEQRPVSKDAT